MQFIANHLICCVAVVDEQGNLVTTMTTAELIHFLAYCGAQVK